MNRRHCHRTVAGLVVAFALILTGCGAAEPELDRDPYQADRPLPAVDTGEMRLPTPFEDLRVVDPGWTTTPLYADGVFLAAAERDGLLEFIAVDVYGDVLWVAQRPLSRPEFTLSIDDTGRALAILSDTGGDDAGPADTTATAYELATGGRVWGPIDVPGPQQGHGLVFAESADTSTPRTALDPTTGEAAATESDASGERILGEYDGTLLLTGRDALMARSTRDGQEIWRIPFAEHGWTATSLKPSIATPPGEGLALIETSESAGALLDLVDGTVLSETARGAAVDLVTHTTVILDEGGLHAYDRENQPLWSLTVKPETTIAALGGVLLYLREAGAIRVHNVVTGDVAEAYDPRGQGRIIVPAHLTTTGAALLLDGERHLIATVEHPPGPADIGP